MSFCNNSNSPIDLIKAETKECDTKCSYQFNYNKSSLVGKNKKHYLEFKLQHNDKSSINFFNTFYYLEKFMIFRKSVHTLNGKERSAELVIEHSQVNNPSKKLVVCVLINIVNHNDSDLDFIIEKMSLLAPNLNNEAVISYPSFSLNNVIPEEHYFNYKSNLFYSKNNNSLCYKKHDIIVIDKELSINNKNYNNLIDLITKHSFPVNLMEKPDTFYSKNKASLGIGVIGENDIYIECKPTGEGDIKTIQERIDIKTEDKFGGLKRFLARNLGFLYLNGSEIFGSIIGAILIIIVLKYLKKFKLKDMNQ